MIRYIHDGISADSITQAYEEFKSLNLWGGPSVYFHGKTISHLRQQQQLADFSYVSLLQDEYFLLLLYGTLAAWGLHRMGGKRRMVGFDVFKDEVNSLADVLSDIKGITLSQSTPNQISDRKEQICFILQEPRITEGVDNASRQNNWVPFLVANSKLLHHLYPDLFPPVDGQHILRYF